MKPDFNTVVNDPDFHGLPFAEQKKVLQRIDPDFMGLPEPEQDKALTGIAQRFAGAKQQDIQMPEQPRDQEPLQAPTALRPAHSPDNFPLVQAHAGQPAQPHPAIQAIAPYYRMMLEGGGAAGGSAFGLLAGGPPAAAAMGGVGYAGGKGIADILDEYGGIKTPRSELDQYLDPAGKYFERGSTAERITRPIRDTATGIGMGAAGELAARGVMAIPNLKTGIVEWVRGNKVLGGRRGAERAAGEYLAASTSDGPIYARNAQEAKEIEDIINAGAKEGDPLFKFSTAERSFDPNQIKAERTAVLPQGPVATMKTQHDATNSEALRAYYQRNFGGQEGSEDVLSALTKRKQSADQTVEAAESAADVARSRTAMRAEDPQATGAKILDELGEAKKPVKATLNELEKAIPDYPLKLKNLSTKINEFLADPKLSINQRKAVEEFKGQLEELAAGGNATTHSAMGINRTLNQNAKEAYNAGKDDIGRIMTRLKQEGLQADIDAVSKLARTGKIIDYQGKAINADKIAADIERNMTELAKMRATGELDIEAAKQGIIGAGKNPPMMVVREGKESFAKRLGDEYTRVTGQAPPIKFGGDSGQYAALEKVTKEMQEVLANASPGQDVGAAMSAYNRFAREEYAKRFKVGAVEQTLRKGQQVTGTKLRIEQIPQQFKTPQGADDLINAVGPEKAKEEITWFFDYYVFNSSRYF